MASNINSLNIDGAELFSDCLAQATLIVKQVLPTHFANITPDAEWDVRDLTGHMLTIVESLPVIVAGSHAEATLENLDDEIVDQAAVDLSVQWQQAVDRTEAVVDDIDMEDTIVHNGEQTSVEEFLVELAGDLLIHSWDLGEAIGMPVRFAPAVAEAVMETTVIPNKVMLNSHTLFTEPIDPPANADLQVRLLALFGRSYAWRTATAN